MAQVVRSLKHPDAIKLLRLSTDKKLRYAWKKCIISSPALISDLSHRYVRSPIIICSNSLRFEFEDLILDKKPKSDLPYKFKDLYVVSPKLLEKISQLKSARSGILATLRMPAPVSAESLDAKRILLLHGIDDLGELGTILRSASAFDWDFVWLTHSCGDPFDPVCIRASQGALFDLPYRVGSIENALKHVRRVSKSSVKLKLDPSKRPDIKLGLSDVVDLKETAITQSGSGSVCLLIQNEATTCPATTDFRSVDIANLEDAAALPLSVRSASILSAVRDRYF